MRRQQISTDHPDSRLQSRVSSRHRGLWRDLRWAKETVKQGEVPSETEATLTLRKSISFMRDEG
jgi:hypothetical protein